MKYDETFSEKEINLIDKLTEHTIKTKDFGAEEELSKILLG